MNAVWAWARLDLRRRWRSLVVLTLLVAIGSGTVAATVVGAHRGGTALDRLVEVTKPATANVTPNSPNFDWDAVCALPYVEACDPWVLQFMQLIDSLPESVVDWPVTTAARFHTLEVPVVLDGRLADPDAADEAVITRRFADLYGYKVGDTVKIHLNDNEQVSQPQAVAAELKGPVPRLRIVGIVRSPWMDTPDRIGRLATTPAYYRKYEKYLYDHVNGSTPTNALLRLKNGEADLPKLRKDIAHVSGRSDTQVASLVADHEQYRRTLRVEATWLLAFAGAATIAALVLVGQALARAGAAGAMELKRSAALGMTPAQRRLAALVHPLLAVGLGVAIANPTAIAASPLFPIGLATDVEPAPGPAVDAIVLLPVLGAFLVAFAGAAVLGTTLATTTVTRRNPRPGLAARAATLPAGPAVSTGLRFALDRGTREAPTPLRSATIAAISATAGIVGALSVAAGLADVEHHRERLGETWQFVAMSGFNGVDIASYDEVVGTLKAFPYTSAVSEVKFQSATGNAGRTSVSVWMLDGPLPTVMTDGRMPEAANEVVLAPSTARELDASTGDTVRLASSGEPVTLRVTGIGFLPSSPVIPTAYYSGAWVTRQGFDRLFPNGWGLHLALGETKAGTPENTLNQRLLDDFKAARPGLFPSLGGLGDNTNMGFNTDASLARIQEVKALPWAFAGFVALLSLGAIGHAVVTSVRRRRGEIAILRTVGMTPRQAGSAFLVQAATIGAIGLVVGVPLGFALGRATWRIVAEYTPLAFVAPAVGLAIAIALAAILTTALLPAIWPAWRASRIPVAETLRTE